MNEAPPGKPRRAFGRTAAATAAVFGAALLIPPGTAAAQDDIDCTALGDDPAKSSLGAALDAALACGVEVRIDDRTWPYTTVSATPQGQLHLVATQAPEQRYRDEGVPDPRIEEWEGSLTQVYSPWSIFLEYTDHSYPLIETGSGVLDWSGEVPVPAYDGTAALYNDLAAGLDLTVDLGVDAADLRFAIADATAWEALATGLAVGGLPLVSTDGGSLFFDDPERFILGGPERTTPFTARDAEGATARADLAVGDDGALAIGLPDAFLSSAAYPLTLSTTWAMSASGINEWGSVTSAAPDAALFRGEGGLDAPYFEASGAVGDAVAGPYCDALSGDACADAEAASYWNFQWPLLERLSTGTHDASFPVDTAVFQVAAADAAACAAPELQRTELYTPVSTWSARPAVIAPAGSGTCQDGTAVYDVTGALADAWQGAEGDAPFTLGMTESAETARFDGGSARLDVHLDIAALTVSNRCSDDPAAPDFHRDQVDANLYVEAWRDDLLDLTWTATVKDSATGETVLTTEPEPVPAGGGTVGAIAPGLPQGAYEIGYEVASGDAAVVHTAPPCHVVVDTATPEPEITVEPGPHRIGDTVAIEVAFGEEAFVNGLDQINVWLNDTDDFGVVDSASLTEAGTVVLEAELTGPVTQWWVQAEDRAGHEFLTDSTVTVVAASDHYDYDGDRLEDLITVRKSDGALMFHAGNGDGTFAAGVAEGTGWGGFDVVMAGDLTVDGNADLLARDNESGTLYAYPGDGSGGVGTRITVGPGWNTMGAFTSGGDFDADGNIDLYAVGKADGRLYLYSGKGNGTSGFNPRVEVGSGWGVMDALVSAGDLDDDGNADLLAHDSRTGQYYLYPGDGTGNLGDRVAVAASLDGSGADRYNQIAAVGDQDGDGLEDLVAIDSRTGELELHSLDGDGTAVREGEVVATSWGGDRLAAVNEERAYDFDGDGAADVFARRDSDGKLYFYSGDGSGGFGPIGTWGTDLKGLNLLETAGDFDGDGFSDLIGRSAAGALYLYRGDGVGGYDPAAREQIGSGWNGMSAIVSGQDFNGDGHIDVAAREQSTGYLWLYPGEGDGGFAARVKIGTGWNAMREITAAGDLDHDGHADVIAVRASNECMYFYSGRGDGTLRPGVQISCNWVGYDQVAAVGDFDGDGHADWIARREADGRVYLYKGNGNGGFDTRASIVTGWTWANAIA